MYTRLRRNNFYTVENFLIPILLFLLSFYDFNRGIDLTDAGYSIARFVNLDQYEGHVIISRFWSCMLGNAFTKLPFGEYWAGISFYCTWIIAGSVLVAYFFCKKYLNYWIVAIAEMVAICFCWNPNVILYDYLSFFLFELAIVFIFAYINSGRKRWLILAGIILGVNTFVRIPNLTQCAAIVLIWGAAGYEKEKGKQMLKGTSMAVGGYLAGVGISLVAILCKYNINELKLALYSLFGLSQTNSNYGLLYMATATFANIGKYWKYLLILTIFMLLLIVVFLLMRKYKGVIKFAGFVASIIIIFLFEGWRKDKLFNYSFASIDYVIGLVGIFLLWCVVISFLNIFLTKDRDNRLLALTFIGVFYVTPLGSNNHVLLTVMNMFLLVPIGIQQTIVFEKEILCKLTPKAILKSAFQKAYRIVTVCCGGFLLIHSILFGVKFIYKDTAECIAENLGTLDGMRTSQKMVDELHLLMEFCKRENIVGNYGILYCNAPGLETILNLKPVMSSPWSDWYTYPYDEFDEGIIKSRILIQDGEKPIVVANQVFASNYDGESPEYLEKDDKYYMLVNYLDDYGYQRVFTSDNFVIYALPVENTQNTR